MAAMKKAAKKERVAIVRAKSAALKNRIAPGFKSQSSRRPLGKRSYGAGRLDRLTDDWNIQLTSQDTETRNDVIKVRARCRDLERNNDHYRRWLGLLETNIIGSEGFQLQMQIKKADGKTLDMDRNNMVQEAWVEWGTRANCTVTRKHTMLESKKIALRSCARDGGLLIRPVEGYANDFGFALQLLETDHLDTYYNTMLSNGNEVRMGVELDKWKAPVAYHVWTRHPGDYYSQYGFQRDRIPAREIIFPFIKDRAESTIGFPWGSAALRKLHMLDAFEEAAVTAARVAACQGGFFEKEATSQQFEGDGTGEDGTQIMEMAPGEYRDLPLGVKFSPNHPEHPTNTFSDFEKAMLRGIASGLEVAYVSLGNDLEGVNFSSIRAGLLDERESYKFKQAWFIGDVLEPIFERWLPCAIMSGKLPAKLFPLSQIDTFKRQWIGRRWPWVDPYKDAMAAVLRVEKGLDSRRNVIAEGGREIEEVHGEIAEDEALDEKLGIEFPSDVPPPLPPTLKNVSKEPNENDT